MSNTVKMLSNFEYKSLFLPGLSEKIYFNNSALQIYRIENYLRNILIPVFPYRTSFNFIIFVTQGRIKQQLELSEYEVLPGETLLIKQGSITRTLEIESNTEGFFIAFENNVLERLSLETNLNLHFFKTSPFISIQEETQSWLKQLYTLLEIELHTNNRDVEIGESLLKSALIKIGSEMPRDVEMQKRNFSITMSFKDLVQRYHLQERRIIFYANKLSISENYLCKCIKMTTGKPPKQWINELNIWHSQILLKDSSKDISSIAFELNYQSISYFTRQFKQVTGMSPSEFRRGIAS